MSQLTCDQAALVEAMFDGRIGPSEGASVERHLKTCNACHQLLVELGSLRTSLRSSASSTVSPLEHQRARLALLRQAARPSVTKRRPAAWLVAGLLMLPLAVFAATSPGSPVQSWLLTSTTSKKLASPKLARTPTRAVGAASPSATPTPSTPRHENGSKAPLPVPIAPPRAATAAAAATAATSRASLDFADAMQALSRSDFGATARKLHAFAAAHPQDARVEDATYLEAIALERAGRRSDAAATAQRYLTLYPDGAHHIQAKRIVGD